MPASTPPRARSGGDDGDRVRIEDTGHGLSVEDASHLFERGYRGSSAGGTSGGGIGLSIVRRLCDLYGWTVTIAPRPERGAVATLVFDRSDQGRSGFSRDAFGAGYRG